MECVAVRSDGNNVELWMGSGVSGHYGGQVSWLSLTQSTNEVRESAVHFYDVSTLWTSLYYGQTPF